MLFRLDNAPITQNTKLASALTCLNALEAHLSKIDFVGRHLFSSKLLAVMQALNVPTSASQNLARMACLGESSSSLGKLMVNMSKRGSKYLQDDSFIDEGRLLFGTTEHVDHIFHWHDECIKILILNRN